MRVLKQSTARDITIFMVDAAGLGKTGLTLTITASKAGASFASITPTVTELTNGWYKLALTTSHTDTLGDLAFHVTASGAETLDFLAQVVAYDMADAVRLGLTALPNANAEASGGLYTRGSGAGQITQDANGRINVNVTAYGGTAGTFSAGRPEVNTTHWGGTAVASANVLIDGAITAAKIAADAITDAKVASDVTIASVTGSVGSVVGNVGGNVVGSVGSISGITFPTNFAALGINASGHVSRVTLVDTTTTNTDMRGTDNAALATDLATVAGYLDTEIADILADTNELQTDWANGGRLDLILDARASQTSVDDLPTNSELATALASADDATLAAIGALNDLSAADVNAEVDAALADAGVTTTRTGYLDKLNITGNVASVGNVAAVETDTQDIQTRIPAALVSGRMDASVGAMASNTLTAAALATDAVAEIQLGLATQSTLAAIGNYVDTEVAQILADTTALLSRLTALRAGYLDNLSAGVATAANVAAIPDALLAAGDVDGYTVEQTLRLLLSALAGKLAGATGSETSETITLRAADDSKTRITATCDVHGNRTALTLDAT